VKVGEREGSTERRKGLLLVRTAEESTAAGKYCRGGKYGYW
jgi:hypothetical protein